MKRIPLHDRDGQVVAHALVDDQDHDRFGCYSWFLKKGYVARTVSSNTVYLHREILGLVAGDCLEGDHKDRNTLDCRRHNLRVLTPSQNQQNRSSVGNRGSSSRFRGVYLYKRTGKWAASLRVDGKNVHLGYFDTEEEAAGVVSAARRERMPFSIDHSGEVVPV